MQAVQRDESIFNSERLMKRIERILLVGHCGFDASALARAVSRVAGDVPVSQVGTQRQLDEQADGSTLLLINRILDGRFDARGGVALIEQLASRDDAPAMMLISNFDDPQVDAQRAGALPGFGKTQMDAAQTQRMLQQLLDGPNP
jgi:hypothetical protein